MGLELARLYVTMRGDTSKLRVDFQRAYHLAQAGSSRIGNITINNVNRAMARTVSSARMSSIAINRYFAAIGLGIMVRNAFRMATQFERVQAAFEVMVGDATKANKLLRDIEDLTKTSPFTYSALLDQAQFLLATGIAADDVVETLRVLGDLAAATGAQFKRLGKAFGDVRARGRLMATEIRQFTEAGVPVLDILSQKYERTTVEILKMVEQGLISFDMLRVALEEVTTGTGKFAGMTVRMEKTLGGTWTRMGDEWSFLMRDMVLEMSPLFKALLELGISGIRNINDALFPDRKPANAIKWFVEIADWIETLKRGWAEWTDFFNARIAYGISRAADVIQNGWNRITSFIKNRIQSIAEMIVMLNELLMRFIVASGQAAGTYTKAAVKAIPQYLIGNDEEAERIFDEAGTKIGKNFLSTINIEDFRKRLQKSIDREDREAAKQPDWLKMSPRSAWLKSLADALLDPLVAIKNQVADERIAEEQRRRDLQQKKLLEEQQKSDSGFRGFTEHARKMQEDILKGRGGWEASMLRVNEAQKKEQEKIAENTRKMIHGLEKAGGMVA